MADETVHAGGSRRRRILLIEDNLGDAELFRAALEEIPGEPFDLERVGRLDSAIACLGAEHEEVAVAVLDLSLPDSHGRESYDALQAAAPWLPVVVLTGTDDSALARRLIQSGAQDYLGKWDLTPSGIQRALDHSIERKQVQIELQRARQEALAAARTKSAFVASMSHEIRTPLNAVLGMADLLLETSLDEEQQDYVEVFRRCGHNLLTLLNNVLDLARMDSGQVELETTPFGLREMLEDTVETFGFAAHKKRLSLVLDVDPALPGRIEGDENRLRQVLVNLIGNAVKFTHTGEVLVDVAPADAGDRIVFRVRDTGPGIPRDKLETIFDDFVQATSSVARLQGGSGLGLALCRKLVTAMEGEIVASIRPEGGSEFGFEVPLPSVPDTAAPEDRPLEGRHVLVVDPSARERHSLRATLESWGASVDERSEVGTALEALADESRRFDAVLLAARMPGAGGLAIAEWLHGHPGRCERVVALLPMDHRIGDVGRCRALGVLPLLRPTRRAPLREALTDGVVGSTAAASTLPVPETLQGAQILLAEDAEDNRKLVLAYLRKSGCRVSVAHDGSEAVSQACENAFDLILMDMQMPILDGWQATRAIRAHEAAADRARTPILALTAYAAEEERRRCIDAGCDALLTKPIDKRSLLTEIARHARIAPIRIEVDPEIADLVPDYVARRREEIETLREAVATGDYATVRRLGHNMKGSGAGYGLPRLTEIGAALEIAGKDGAGREASRHLDDLESHLDRVELVPAAEAPAAER